MRRFALLAALSVFLSATAAGAGARFPEQIDLPNGFFPEGIDIARGGTFFVGSIPTGAIYRGSVRTGQSAVLVPAEAGKMAIGLDVDRRGRIFVAGGPTGTAFVYDAETGAELASYQLTSTSPPTFVNDVVVTKDGAYFTDSFKPFLYRVPIARNGELGTTSEAIPLTGDITYQADFNVNGIDASPNGKTLVIVQSNTGQLFTLDPPSGVAELIDLGGTTVPGGDGLLLDGKTLYVVQGGSNQVGVVALRRDLESGRVIASITSPGFDVPTTIAEFGRRLYVVNARFGTPPTATTEYWVTQVRKLGDSEDDDDRDDD
jgi:sugar lactone lactonase YvrE